MEAATGEYDLERTLRGLQRRGEIILSLYKDGQIRLADTTIRSHVPLREWWWLAAVCDHPWGWVVASSLDVWPTSSTTAG